MDTPFEIPLHKETSSSNRNVSSDSAGLKSFFSFCITEKLNQRLLGILLAGLIIQYIIFKFLYPYPDFFSDSYSYIYAAQAHLNINIWPIGYSKFLEAFHDLSHSHTLLIGFQYFLIELAAIYFYFTWLFLFKPKKIARNILFIFLFFNPLFLYLANYVNSDPLFAALSLIWFTQLLWIIYHPRYYHLITQAILLFFCFTIRNNAYYYPIAAAIAFILCNHNIKYKVIGIVAPILLVSIFIVRTREAAYDLTGTRQFSLFTGWQLANNALYMRGHINVDSTKLPNIECRKLDKISRNFYVWVGADFNDYLYSYVANYFIRQPEAPLKQYYIRNYNASDNLSTIVSWAKASVTFGEYGQWLIKNYPLTFAKYFLLLNVKNYFLPPLEKLEIYNLGSDKLDPIAQEWFNLESPTVTSISNKTQGKLLYLYPIFFLFINLSFVTYLINYLVTKRIGSANSFLGRSIILISSILIINFCFSVFATINVLRYQIFPMILCLAFMLILRDVSEKVKINKKLI